MSNIDNASNISYVDFWMWKPNFIQHPNSNRYDLEGQTITEVSGKSPIQLLPPSGSIPQRAIGEDYSVETATQVRDRAPNTITKDIYERAEDARAVNATQGAFDSDHHGIIITALKAELTGNHVIFDNNKYAQVRVWFDKNQAHGVQDGSHSLTYAFWTLQSKIPVSIIDHEVIGEINPEAVDVKIKCGYKSHQIRSSSAYLNAHKNVALEGAMHANAYFEDLKKTLIENNQVGLIEWAANLGGVLNIAKTIQYATTLLPSYRFTYQRIADHDEIKWPNSAYNNKTATLQKYKNDYKKNNLVNYKSIFNILPDILKLKDVFANVAQTNGWRHVDSRYSKFLNEFLEEKNPPINIAETQFYMQDEFGPILQKEIEENRRNKNKYLSLRFSDALSFPFINSLFQFMEVDETGCLVWMDGINWKTIAQELLRDEQGSYGSRLMNAICSSFNISEDISSIEVKAKVGDVIDADRIWNMFHVAASKTRGQIIASTINHQQVEMYSAHYRG
jgi:hypothetical protein